MAKLKKEINIKDGAVYIKVLEENINTVFKISQVIDRYIDNKKPLPRHVFDRLWSVFINIQHEQTQHYEQSVKERQDKVVQYFINDAKYLFSYTKEEVLIGESSPDDLKSYKRVYRYSLEEMIKEAILKVMQSEFDEGKMDRDTCVQTSYTHLTKYRSQLSQEYQDFLTYYKLTVISGYIALQYDYVLGKDLKLKSLLNIPSDKELIYDKAKSITKKVM